MQRMDLNDFIVRRVELARRVRGISVAELARRIGVDRKRLWRVLNGQHAMRVDEFVKLCTFFGLGIKSFIPKARTARRPPERAPRK